MKITEIVPYAKNARHNAKAIPVVAESIREFGFLGQIVLESKDSPVIVTGHTRVEACKLLGWSEIPDENIDYADGLTDEQIKAYRLADNRASEIATWNKALLKNEIRALDKATFDMGRFNFNFKSKLKPYGAERCRTDDTYNLRVVSSFNCAGTYDMPKIKVCDYTPKELIGFNYAKTAKDKSVGLHFFVDDYQFERLWNTPEQYLELIKSFDCVLSPDFSLYMDMPLPMQMWNEYRRRALANYWQRAGVKVIPTLSWTDKRSYGFCFDGLPKNATVAVSTVGTKSKEARKVWHEGMNAAMQALTPKRVLLYGGNVGFEFGCEVVEYATNTAFRG